MNVCSIEWVACLLVFSALFYLIPSARLRQFLLAAGNLGFIATMMPNAAAWMALAAFVGAGYLAACVLKRSPRKSILVLYLAGLLSAFVFCKQYAFLKLLLPEALFQKVIATVGWSYILFRQIQVAVDAYQGQIENLAFWNYLNFQLNVFGFVAGPIQRYQDFCQSWRELAPILSDLESILLAYLRLFVGVLKITVLAGPLLAKYKAWDFLLGNAVMMGQATHARLTLRFIGLFYSYPLYIYFNFSGYCDMVIAGASLFGLKMPENFDQPYLSRNMIEFWTRWHRTLGLWIRDYIFTPMYMALVTRWPAKAPHLAFLCYFAAFFLAGVWHGSSWNFVAYGILNGLGLAATKLWETYLIKRLGRPGLRSYLQNPVIRVAAVVFTLNFACLTILFFGSDFRQTLYLLKQVFTVPI
jgi:D-alanyl-lipoteichoic acid acyltransferase DltB (MBOAT superfamily)